MWVYAVVLLAFIIDRLTKSWAADYLLDRPTVYINHFLSLEATYNRGVAFGLFQGIGPLIGWLTVGVVLFLLVYLWRLPREMWILRLGLALLAGGALGNMVDRIVAGRVLDFIASPLRPGIFNVADILINAGMILAVVGYWLQARHLTNDVDDSTFPPG